MPIPSDRFAVLAGQLLAALEADMTARGIDLPPDRFTATGPVSLDGCGILAVSLMRVFVGLPSAGVDPGLRSRELTLTAELLAVVTRCIPTATVQGATVIVPTSDELTAAAQITAADAVVLSEGIRQAVIGGLFEPCTEVALLDTTALENSGGVGGWQTTVRVQV